MSTAALLEQVIEELYARHTADTEAAGVARREYEERRGRVHQDDELWEPWSAAFVEWYVVERVGPGGVPPALMTAREMRDAGDARADLVTSLVTSHRSLFEVTAMKPGRIEVIDLLGGAEFHVDEQRAMHGVDVGDVAELRLVGTRPRSDRELRAEGACEEGPIGHSVRFGRTFIYHPKAARNAIVERSRAMLAKGSSRRDVIDQIAQLRVQVTRYRHMPPSRVYELGSRIMG